MMDAKNQVHQTREEQDSLQERGPGYTTEAPMQLSRRAGQRAVSCARMP